MVRKGEVEPPSRTASHRNAHLRAPLHHREQGEPLGARRFRARPEQDLEGRVEHVLEGDARSSVPGALASKLGLVFIEQVLDPQPGVPSYPGFRLARLRALAEGTFQWPTAREAWKAAFWCPCPSANLSFASAEAIDMAIDALA